MFRDVHGKVWWLQVMYRTVKNVWQKIFEEIEVNSEMCSDIQIFRDVHGCLEIFMKKFGDYKLCIEQ